MTDVIWNLSEGPAWRSGPHGPVETSRRFFFARGGLRSLQGMGPAFLGYDAAELFWVDVLDLAHRRDLSKLQALISLLVGHPGGSGGVKVRLRDADGYWRRVAADLRNVVEWPGDAGLLIADLRVTSFSSEP